MSNAFLITGWGFGAARYGLQKTVVDGLHDSVTVQLYETQDSVTVIDAAQVKVATYTESLSIRDIFNSGGSDTDQIVETVMANAVAGVITDSINITDIGSVDA